MNTKQIRELLNEVRSKSVPGSPTDILADIVELMINDNKDMIINVSGIGSTTIQESEQEQPECCGSECCCVCV